jgi:hypothetical protein
MVIVLWKKLMKYLKNYKNNIMDKNKLDSQKLAFFGIVGLGLTVLAILIEYFL